MIFVFDEAENIVGKGENGGNQHFLLCPQCFLQYPSQNKFQFFSHIYCVVCSSIWNSLKICRLVKSQSLTSNTILEYGVGSKMLESIYSKFDFSTLPPEDDEDYVDMGGAILSFYAGLVDLLGRCAPDAETIKAGRSDALRARAILRSLVSMEDLEGVLGLRFILPVGQEGDGMSYVF